MNNLFISYDLHPPGQHYQRVSAAIEAIGGAVKVHLSLYYVKTSIPVAEVERRIWAAMDSNDRLVVIDAKAARWQNLLIPAANFMTHQWDR